MTLSFFTGNLYSRFLLAANSLTKIFHYPRFCHILMVSIMSKELLVKQMLRLVLCECAFRTWCMSNFFFLMNIFDWSNWFLINRALFSCVSKKLLPVLKQIPGLIGRKEFILHSQWELKVKLTKLPKVQKYVGDQVLIGFGFVSDWLIKWPEFSDQSPSRQSAISDKFQQSIKKGSDI